MIEEQSLGVVANFWLLNFNYDQYSKVQWWKKPRDFLKILSTITGCFFFSFIYLFIYSFLVLKSMGRDNFNKVAEQIC